MEPGLIPILILAAASLLLATGMLAAGCLVGPRRFGKVKRMPYESGMDPIHDARRRFDVRFHLVAVVFLVFDVELLFLYPWAVANKDPQGIAEVVSRAGSGSGYGAGLVFAEAMFFVALLAMGFVYAWRKGVFRWR